MNVLKHDLEWGKSLEKLKKFESRNIIQFIEGSGSQRLLKESYSLFISSYVKDVRTASEGNSVFIKARCYARMRKHEMPRELFCEILCTQNNLKVKEGNCSCKAGLGKCIHLIALLQMVNHFILMGYDAIPEEQTCTSLEQQWHKPRGKKIEPASLAESCFAKPNPARKGDPLIYSFSDKHIALPTDEEIKKLSGAIREINAAVPLASISSNSSVGCRSFTFGNLPYGATLCHQLPVAETEVDPCFKLPVSVLRLPQEVSYDERYNINLKDCYDLEYNTRGQSNALWDDARKGRMTASNFGVICKRTFVSSEFLRTIYEKKNLDNIPSVKYGKANESVALNLLRATLPPDQNLHRVGFIVNPGIPFLGCSPDGIIYDTIKKTSRLVEVKCPSSKKGKSLEEACRDTKFYLKKNGENVELLTNSIQYYQVQGQLVISGLNSCDFIVYNGYEIWVTRVLKDDQFCCKLIKKLVSFFKNHYEPFVRYLENPPRPPCIISV